MSQKLILTLACLLLWAVPAQAQITYDGNNDTATAGALWSDGTETNAWTSAPTNGALVYVYTMLLSVAVDFNTPTASNITFTCTQQQVDSSNDVTIQLCHGVATGTVGAITVTTTGNDANNGTLNQGSFTGSAGFGSIQSITPCSASATTTTQFDATCTGIQSAAGVDSVFFCASAVGSSAVFTLDATYTTLSTNASSFAIMGYYLPSGQTTTDCLNTTSANRNGVTIQAVFNQGTPGGATCNGGLLTLGAGKACDEH